MRFHVCAFVRVRVWTVMLNKLAQWHTRGSIITRGLLEAIFGIFGVQKNHQEPGDDNAEKKLHFFFIKKIKNTLIYIIMRQRSRANSGSPTH